MIGSGGRSHAGSGSGITGSGGRSQTGSRRDVIARGNPWMTTGYGGVGSARTLGQAYLLGT